MGHQSFGSGSAVKTNELHLTKFYPPNPGAILPTQNKSALRNKTYRYFLLFRCIHNKKLGKVKNFRIGVTALSKGEKILVQFFDLAP